MSLTPNNNNNVNSCLILVFEAFGLIYSTKKSQKCQSRVCLKSNIFPSIKFYIHILTYFFFFFKTIKTYTTQKELKKITQSLLLFEI